MLLPRPAPLSHPRGKVDRWKADKAIENALIVIEGDKIVSVTPGGTAPAGVEVLDLSNSTVLPGLIDTHTHVLLNGDITAEEYDEQLLKQSIPYRAILAERNAHIALDHGFTTLRDLETEGAMYADVDVKTAIERGEVPGPRMQVATRAMAPTGMYPLLGYSWELKMPTACSSGRRGRSAQSRARTSHVRRRLDQILFRPPLSLRSRRSPALAG